MLLSSKILRGLKIEGWKIYQPFVEIMEPSATPPQPPVDPSSSPPSEQLVFEQEIKIRQETILRTAREEAAQLQKQVFEGALQEAEVIKNRAREDGYLKGYKKGEEEGFKLQEEGRMFLEEAHREYRQIFDGAEKEIIQLAISLAEKFLNYQLELDSNSIISIISRIIDNVSGDQEFCLHVNPRDEEVCLNNKDRIMKLLKNKSILEVYPNPEIPHGSCRIETETAEIEFLLKKELEILAGTLLKLANS